MKNISSQELDAEKKRKREVQSSLESALKEKHKRANDFIRKVKLEI